MELIFKGLGWLLVGGLSIVLLLESVFFTILRLKNLDKPEKPKAKKKPMTKGDKARDSFVANVLEAGTEAKSLEIPPEISFAEMRSSQTSADSLKMQSSLDELSLDDENDEVYTDDLGLKSSKQVTSKKAGKSEEYETIVPDSRESYDPYLHV